MILEVHYLYLMNLLIRITSPATRFLARQERILLFAFSILMNLAENVQIEHKMVTYSLCQYVLFLCNAYTQVKRGVVRYLSSTLARQSDTGSSLLQDLQVLLLQFLRKLSASSDNVTTLIDLNIVTTLSSLITSTSSPVHQGLMRLLFNLSFSELIRNSVINHTQSIVQDLATNVRFNPFPTF